MATVICVSGTWASNSIGSTDDVVIGVGVAVTACPTCTVNSLTNAGTLTAAAPIMLTTTASLANSGTIGDATNYIDVTVGGLLTNSGEIFINNSVAFAGVVGTGGTFVGVGPYFTVQAGRESNGVLSVTGNVQDGTWTGILNFSSGVIVTSGTITSRWFLVQSGVTLNCGTATLTNSTSGASGWDPFGTAIINGQNATFHVHGTFVFNAGTNVFNMGSCLFNTDGISVLAISALGATLNLQGATIVSTGTVNGLYMTITGSGTIIGGTVTNCTFQTGMTFTNVTLGANVVVNGTATVTGTTHGSLTATRVNVQSSNAAALVLTATDIYVCTTAAVNLTGSTGAVHQLAPGLPYTVASGLTVDALIPLGTGEL